MKLIVVCIFVTLCAASKEKRDITKICGSLDDVKVDEKTCPEYPYFDLIESYKDHAYNLTIETYKHSAPRGGYNFVLSSHLLWLTLSAMAEGADPPNKQKLLKLLMMPEDPCLREKYYEIAASRMTLSPYVNVNDKQTIMIDDDAVPSSEWQNYVWEHSLVNVISGPIKRNPVVAANKVRHLMSARFPKLNIQGNSVLFNTIDFDTLWTNAFDDAVIKRSPFYNQKGEKIGSVDLMTTRQRALIGFVPSLHSKILALPLGKNSEYIIVFALVVDETEMKPIVENMKSTIVRDVIEAFKDSVEPIDIGIPRVTISSEMDAKTILQDIGFENLWTDPGASKYVSTPPALPGNYLQRTTVTLDKKGLNPPSCPPPSFVPAADSKDRFWKEFLANRPFMFGLFDTETYTVIISAMFTRPTYPN